MKSIKVYIDQQNMAVLTCPFCGKSRMANVSSFVGRKGPVRVQCSCNNLYGAQLEIRRQYRKSTDLDGRYAIPGSQGMGGKMKVKNVSMGGIGFATFGPHVLKPGDTVSVEFTLDDDNDSKIRRRGTVRVVESKYIGLQFSEAAGAYDAALGFYLRK